MFLNLNFTVITNPPPPPKKKTHHKNGPGSSEEKPPWCYSTPARKSAPKEGNVDRGSFSDLAEGCRVAPRVYTPLLSRIALWGQI